VSAARDVPDAGQARDPEAQGPSAMRRRRAIPPRPQDRM
jgi:hypothetical protein